MSAKVAKQALLRSHFDHFSWRVATALV